MWLFACFVRTNICASSLQTCLHVFFPMMNCFLFFERNFQENVVHTKGNKTNNVFPNLLHESWFNSKPRTFVALVAQKFVNLIRCMKTTRGFVQVAPEAMTAELSLKDLQEAAVAGFKPAATDEDAMTSVQTEESAKLEILGDINLVSEEQKESLMQLKKPQKYSTMKLKMVSG